MLKGQGFLDHYMKNLKPVMEPKIVRERKAKAVEDNLKPVMEPRVPNKRKAKAAEKKKELTLSDLAAIDVAQLGLDTGPCDLGSNVPAQVLCEQAEADMVASRTAIQEAGA